MRMGDGLVKQEDLQLAKKKARRKFHGEKYPDIFFALSSLRWTQ
jgi:hypothetical protein